MQEMEVYIRGVDGSIRKGTPDMSDVNKGEVAFIKPADPRELDDGDRLLSWMASLCGYTGDFVSFAAHVLQVPPCRTCQLRNMVLHRVKELGIRRAMAMLLRATFNQITGANQDKLEAELKAVLGE
jgi:hypothetical protein